VSKLPSKAVRVVSDLFEVSQKELLGPTRGSPKIAEARQVLMYILHTDFHFNFTQIGTLLGRYRKTVSHGIEMTRIRKKEQMFRWKLLNAQATIKLP
jgi:chromosomal replication initiation ATPase DnaA